MGFGIVNDGCPAVATTARKTGCLGMEAIGLYKPGSDVPNKHMCIMCIFSVMADRANNHCRVTPDS